MNMFLNWFYLIISLFLRQNDTTLYNHPAWEKLPRKNCGISGFVNRLVGEEVNLGAFPWVARLGYQKPSKRISFTCGASLISIRFLISAANCFNVERNYFVRLGEHDFQEERRCDEYTCPPPPQDIPLTGIYVHENYSNDIKINDIAVLKMKHDAILNDFVGPICLPQGPLQNPSFVHTGQALTAGWDRATVFAFDSDILLYVPLNFTDIEKCVKLYPNMMTDQSQLCVGAGKERDSCDGDDGGPLMKPFTLQGNQRYFLIGVVSYGENKCGVTPSIYTNVAFFLEWIFDKVV